MTDWVCMDSTIQPLLGNGRLFVCIVNLIARVPLKSTTARRRQWSVRGCVIVGPLSCRVANAKAIESDVLLLVLVVAYH